MKVVYIGCLRFSQAVLEKVLSLPESEVVGIVTRRSSSFNADFCSLEPTAEKYGIPCFTADQKDQSEIARWIRRLEPEVIFCFGWSFLLKREILEIPRLGAVGYHPAALPGNRGRHPIIWALALGLRETASTFFLMNEGADAGEILDQETVEIAETDDAGSLYQKLSEQALKQIERLVTDLEAGRVKKIPQNGAPANYWRKRDKLDGEIDWRMSARSIHNLVRALARPYPGAHCVSGGKEIKIWRTEPAGPSPENIEPGKILRTDDTTFTVKCGEGALRVIEHEFPEVPQEGQYL